MSKRTLTFLVTILLSVALTGCPAGEATPTPEPAATDTPVVEEATATPMPEEEPTETPVAEEEPTETPMAEEEPTETPAAEEEPTEAPPAAGELRTPQEAALEAAGGEEIGGTVSLIGVWGGSEQEALMEMLAPFEEATGIEVQYTGTRDINAVLTTRLQGGDPPDLASLPGPGQMAEYAEQGQLVDLSEVLDMERIEQEYAGTWTELGTVEDTLGAVFMKASVKGLIWYNPNVWEENDYQIPETWDATMELSQQIADEGNTPWCVAVESAAASGWPGTDWIEDFVLRQSGEETYREWYEGNLQWTSDEIRQAWEAWGEIVANADEMVYGGVNTMLTTNFANVGDPLFTDPPGCYMVHQADFIAGFFVENTPDIEPVTDFNFFSFPPIQEGMPESTVIAGDLVGMFNDTPQARALINYITTPEAQNIWVSRGGAISPNQSVPLDSYPDELSRRAAQILTTAEVVVFDASDQMPEAMNAAFWQAILEYIQSPDDLDSILENLDSVQADAYAQ